MNSKKFLPISIGLSLVLSFLSLYKLQDVNPVQIYLSGKKPAGIMSEYTFNSTHFIEVPAGVNTTQQFSLLCAGTNMGFEEPANYGQFNESGWPFRFMYSPLATLCTPIPGFATILIIPLVVNVILLLVFYWLATMLVFRLWKNAVKFVNKV